MPLPPIVLFTYNRPWHTAQTIAALQKNILAAESELFVFADGAKGSQDLAAVQEVHDLVQQITGFRQVHVALSPTNKGLAASIIAGVSQVLENYPSVIVLEDDMLCATNFLNFMHDALEMYAQQPQIFSITGYTFPIQIPADYTQDVFIAPRPSSWGWATWRDRWAKVDWEIADFQAFIQDKAQRQAFNAGGNDMSVMLLKQKRGEIDSWAIRWAYSHFKHGAYCVYPTRSKIQNIGADQSGVHTPATTKYEVVLNHAPYTLPAQIGIDERIGKAFKRFFRRSLFRKIINWWKYGFST